MKKALTSIMLAVLMFFTATDLSAESEIPQAPAEQKPLRLAPPFAVTLERWTEIVKSLKKKDGSSPEKPLQSGSESVNRMEL